jgi:anaerobic ribonucleoside-triphosphate reductase activating protein
VIALTDLGRNRYGEAKETPVRKRIQTHFDGKRVWFIGIPERGDMNRLAELCRERGLDMVEVSWQP